MSVTSNRDVAASDASYSFATVQTPAGTSPTADSVNDTLTLTSTGGTITITGNSTTDTINLEASGGSKFARITDETVSNVNGATSVAGAWNTRQLTTLSDPDSIGVSIDTTNDTFTLPAGKYKIDCMANGFRLGKNAVRLYNVTGTAEHTRGLAGENSSGNAQSWGSPLRAIVNIAGSTVFRIEHFTQNANIMGSVSGAGGNEVHLEMIIEKYG